jgi:hypothetical protein
MLLLLHQERATGGSDRRLLKLCQTGSETATPFRAEGLMNANSLEGDAGDFTYRQESVAGYRLQPNAKL